MRSHSDSTNSVTNSLSQLTHNMFSYNSNNIMIAAILSLFLVILFVLLLHIYAKWFLAQSRPRRRQSSSSSSEPSSFHHHHINIEAPTKGLDSKIVSAIPTFEVKAEEEEKDLECVICLSDLEVGEIGRKLPKCRHVFHVECIDIWLSSHCSCPICRESIVSENVVEMVIGGGATATTTGSNEIGESVSVSETETSLSLLGYSLKKMLSKVFLSSHVNELD